MTFKLIHNRYTQHRPWEQQGSLALDRLGYGGHEHKAPWLRSSDAPDVEDAVRKPICIVAEACSDPVQHRAGAGSDTARQTTLLQLSGSVLATANSSICADLCDSSSSRSISPLVLRNFPFFN